MTSILLINGPNLNLLGIREPEIYGTRTLDDHVKSALGAATSHGFHLEHVQSNHEGAIVDAIHKARDSHDAIIINAGAFTHYAWAIHDALACFNGPVVELHISNPHAREEWRHTSVITPAATGVIAGFGSAGYRMAVAAVAHLLAENGRA